MVALELRSLGHKKIGILPHGNVNLNSNILMLSSSNIIIIIVVVIINRWNP